MQRTIEDELARGSSVFFNADNHAPDDPEFKMFPPHCVRGSEEAQVIPELSKYPGKLVPKTHDSAFFATALDETLRDLKPHKLTVCGVCTDICVLYTVADARNRGYQVEVPAGCVATFDTEAHEWALQHMEKILGAMIT